MKRLLLVSSSKVHGSGYLEHCEDEVQRLFADCGRVLFVPYALFDRGAYAAQARQRFAEMGFELDSIHDAADPVAAVQQAEGIFIGGGNTFRLLAELQSRRLLEPIRRRVEAGCPYLGTSAGSNVACPTIRTTNDMPIVEPESFSALGLVHFQINPHYLDADPHSTPQGETTTDLAWGADRSLLSPARPAPGRPRKRASEPRPCLGRSPRARAARALPCAATPPPTRRARLRSGRP
jgi:dipeptidase E